MRLTARPFHKGFASVVLLAMGTAGCSHHFPRVSNPAARVNNPIAPARLGTSESGVASWYGVPYHGRRAASGEVYDMEKMTAAHRKLPFQTWVEVTNLENGKRVEVRINDRGPFAHGRIIDLSQAAARDIDMVRSGTARVRLKVIARPLEVPAPPPTPVTAPVFWYAVQAGAFSGRDRAETTRAQMEDRYADARVIAGPRNLWRVIVGRQMTMEEAGDLAARVRAAGGEALVIAEPGVPEAGLPAGSWLADSSPPEGPRTQNIPFRVVSSRASVRKGCSCSCRCSPAPW